MAAQPLIVTIVGVPNLPNITEVNIRSIPTTINNAAVVAKLRVGTTGYVAMDVEQDQGGIHLNGKVYQWFKIPLPSGGTGWVRDDLISVVGDASRFGYGIISTPTVPFFLTRGAVTGTSGTVSAQPAVQPATAVQPVTAVQPATAVQPVTAVQPTSSEVVMTPAAPVGQSGPPKAICMMKGGGNVRQVPNTSGAIVAKMNYKDSADIVDARQGDNNDYFKWVKISYQGKEGWIREDLVRLTGAFGKFNIAAEDLYPNPAQDSWWSRDFDSTGNVLGVVHHGWDHAGNVGAPITAGPFGGYVVKDAYCQKCGAGGISAVENAGFGLSDGRVLNDAGWNYGYGHYVIVRYDHNILPASVKTWLSSNNLANAHAFVMYAHLHEILVKTGQTVTAGQQIGKLGNSGNSQGAHLHLELRFGTDANAQWPALKPNLVTPARLFLR